MSVQTAVAILFALVPVAAIWGLLEWANRVTRRREATIGRQIALTDALHRELGAVVAPDVRGSRWRGWTVSMRVSLHSEPLVGAISRITHELFRRLDEQDPPRVRLVLIARPELRPIRLPAPLPTRVSAQLSRAA
jgi:hypothetical protein